MGFRLGPERTGGGAEARRRDTTASGGLAASRAPEAARGTLSGVRVAVGVAAPLAGSLAGWDARPGAGGQVTVPAYGGEVRLALDLAEHRATRTDAPDFWAVDAALGWGPVLRLGALRVTPAAEVGAGRYSFDDDERFPAQLSSESEVLAGAYVRAAGPLAGRLEAWAEAGARRVFFSTPQTVWSGRAGLAVRL